jgi:N-acetylmuramoyl-L-alanine amidase
LKKVFLITAIAIFLVCTVKIASFYKTSQAISYKYGSRGAIVTQIQTKLKKWGYYTGGVDGAYGYKTYLAVKYFQRKNGLSADGVAGNRTLAALGIKTASTSNTTGGGDRRQSNLLGRAITGEARGETYVGQVAIGGVILNRTRDPRFPSTIPEVIYQPGAFTAVADGQINIEPVQSCLKAANDALNGWDPSGGAIYYYNPATATNKWIWSRPVIKVIGKHKFCR